MSAGVRHVLVLGSHRNKTGFLAALGRWAQVTYVDVGYRDATGCADATFQTFADGRTDNALLQRERIPAISFLEWVHGAAGRIHRDTPLTHVTTVFEPCVEAVSVVAAQLGLPGLRPELTPFVRHKGKMAELGVRTPAFVSVRSHSIERQDANRLAEIVAPPWVLKPASATRSIGVRRAEDPDKLVAVYPQARQQLWNERSVNPYLSHAALDDWLVTEQVLGVELEADVYVEHGRIVWRAVMQKTVNEYRDEGFEEARSICPPAVALPVVDAFLQDLAWRVYEVVARPSGVGRFLMYPEIIYDPDSGAVTLLEVAYRNAGGQCPALVKHAYGIDTFELAAACALGEPLPRLPSIPKAAAAAQILYTTEAGVFRGIVGLSEQTDDSKLVGEIWESLGVPIYPVTSYLGYVLCVAKTTDEAEQRLDAIVPKLKVQIDTPSGMKRVDVVSGHRARGD